MTTRLRVSGTVQGVGFRPFVHRLATELGLDGAVGNDAAGVWIDLAGPAEVVVEFRRRLVAEPPPLARIEEVTEVAPTTGVEPGFRIVASSEASGPTTVVAPPDTATCDACLAEVLDPDDRRYRHAFATCTDCGPRFTIIERLPYDRPATTMAGFPLCDACAAEYEDPTDRRFHAQPVSCHDCGPTLHLTGTGGLDESFERPARRPARDVQRGVGGRIASDHAIGSAQRLLLEGAIVAIKGVGGHHLACRADDADVVRLLRERKHRPGKPFALLARDLDVVRRVAHVDDVEADVLASPAAPIVLLRRHEGGPLTDGVAPGNPLVGVMLASNPLHHLLLRTAPGGPEGPLDLLVLTSGNLAEEPICTDDADARERLGAIADAFLVHDRPIAVPCDDSVVRVLDGQPTLVRRSRGYVPTPIALPVHGEPALALGAELKNTVCLTDGERAWLSQHVGDMGSLATLRAFETTVSRTEAMHEVRPAALACDTHPDHTAHRWARRRTSATPLVTVQHHHAHVAAVMAEHGVAGPVVGVAFDGTGYGTAGDGSPEIWGGELLRADLVDAQRIAHLAPVLLPGGDAAVRHPRRIALSHLHAAGIAWADDLAPVAATDPGERDVLAVQLERGVNAVPTTSMGRLFDAVASLLDLRHDITYEAQAAIELEVLADDHRRSAGDAAMLHIPAARFPSSAAAVLDVHVLVRDVVRLLRSGAPPDAIALGFHHAVAGAVAEVAVSERATTGIATIALTGGCFANALLLELTATALRERDFDVLRHRVVPPNDGGIALGQAAVAVARSATVAPVDGARRTDEGRVASRGATATPTSSATPTSTRTSRGS